MFEQCRTVSSLDTACKEALDNLNIEFKKRKSEIMSEYQKREKQLRAPKENYKRVPVEYITSNDSKPVIYANYKLITGKAASNEIIINTDGTIFI